MPTGGQRFARAVPQRCSGRFTAFRTGRTENQAADAGSFEWPEEAQFSLRLWWTAAARDSHGVNPGDRFFRARPLNLFICCHIEILGRNRNSHRTKLLKRIFLSAFCPVFMGVCANIGARLDGRGLHRALWFVRTVEHGTALEALARRRPRVKMFSRLKTFFIGCGAAVATWLGLMGRQLHCAPGSAITVWLLNAARSARLNQPNGLQSARRFAKVDEVATKTSGKRVDRDRKALLALKS